MSVELPPLPATPYVLARESDGYSDLRLLNEQAFTSDQMRAYAEEALKARKPLTENEIRLIGHHALATRSGTDVQHLCIARAIERAHGIGES